MRTSIGYHTFTISKALTQEDADKLWKDIKRYRDTTGEIETVKREPYGKDPFARHYGIVYPYLYKGLSWEMRFSNRGFYIGGEFKPCSIKATINPKVFTGEKSYITAADMSYIAEAESIFNQEAAKISPLLGRFGDYSLNRLDYCINFNVSELNIKIPSHLSDELPKMIMRLIKRGDIPDHYHLENYKEEYEFYLKCGSTVINCYWKHIDLHNNFSDCPDLEESHDIIRFEIQHRYPKAYAVATKLKKKNELQRTILMDKLREKGCFEFVENDVERQKQDQLYNGFAEVAQIDTMRSILEGLTTDESCSEVIEKYFNDVIKPGDYFSFDTAKRILESKVNSWEKILRLTYALERVRDYGSIANAKIVLQGKELAEFRRSLRELGQLRINPVTIPSDWGIDYIPNLLNNYYKVLEKERLSAEAEKRNQQIFEDYIKDCRKQGKSWFS